MKRVEGHSVRSTLLPAAAQPRKAARACWILLLVMASGCGLLRTPARECRKAEGLIQKAVRMCPEAAQLKTETFSTTLKGDSASTAIAYTQADIDAVLAQCDSLAAAKAATLLNLVTEDFSHAPRNHVDEGEALRRAQRDRLSASMNELRKQACNIAPLHINDTLITLDVYLDKSTGELRAHYEVHDRTATTTHTVPQVVQGPVVPAESGGWLMAVHYGGWFVALVLLLLLLRRYLRGFIASIRANDPEQGG